MKSNPDDALPLASGVLCAAIFSHSPVPTIDLRLIHSRLSGPNTRIGKSIYSQFQISAGSSLGLTSVGETAEQHWV